jgi:ribulose-phosphate 3-epimerase
MKLQLGVKHDPIEGRFGFDWLFGIMNDFRVQRLQLGSSFATFHAEQRYFHRLRSLAEKKAIQISSLFTSHRELIGFTSGDPDLEAATRFGWERLIQVASWLGAASAGSNLGIILRDQPLDWEPGLACFCRHMKELMHMARRKGLSALTIEPMSSVWEFPSTPDQLQRLMDELAPVHKTDPEGTVPFYLCGDISHGYADGSRRVIYDNWQIFEAGIPWTWEFHVKNTDSIFNATFGFSKEERRRGIVDLKRLKEIIEMNAGRFPGEELTGYLEIPGPKLGREYSDCLLGGMLSDSLAALRAVFPAE